jgi:3',5'-cyclic-AMP phosphodiesterase
MRTFAYITDIHLDEPMTHGLVFDARVNWLRILADVQARGIDTIVFGGDIGESSANAWFFETLRPFKLHISLGNHDTSNVAIQHFRNEHLTETPELYYAFEDAEAKYLFLDSSKNTLSDQALLWFKDQMQDVQKPVALFIHHPVLRVNTLVDERYPLTNRNMLREILTTCGQPVTIFSGHYHTNDDQQWHNLRQVVTLSAAFQVAQNTTDIVLDDKRFGYRIVRLEAGQIVEMEVVEFDAG